MSPELEQLFQKNKRLVILVACIFLLAGGAAIGYSFITKPTRTITVVGVGTKKMPPERAIVSFSLLYEGDNQQGAIAEGEARFSKLLQAVEKFSPQAVDTTPYQVAPRATSRTADGRVQPGATYQYVNAARVTIDTPQKVTELIKSLYDNGATVVGQVRYVAKDQDKADRELQELAVKNATEKAKQMAKTAGSRIGNVLTIQEGVSTGQSGTSVSGSQSQVTTPSQPPSNSPSGNANQIELQAQVTVVYELW